MGEVGGERGRGGVVYASGVGATGMSTAKRLVLSLRRRKHTKGLNSATTSSTRLVSAGTSPGHELVEISIVSDHRFSYGGCIVKSNSTNDTSSVDAAVVRSSTGERQLMTLLNTSYTLTENRRHRYINYLPLSPHFPFLLSLYRS